MISPSVQIRKIDGYDLPVIEEAVGSFLAHLKGQKLTRNKRVLIKTNALGAYAPVKAVTTHPVVLEALIRYFLERGKEVWLGDSPGGTVNFNTVWKTCGYAELAERYPIKVVNLSTLGFRELSYRGIKVKVSEALWKCGIVINAAKYKTHSLMAYTGALKNLYGLVPGMVKSEYHRENADTKSFAELLTALYALTRNRITYSFIDGIVGMDGAGPSAGNPKPFGLLFGSASIPALDYTASRIMGFSLGDVPYLSAALHLEGILPSRIRIPTSFTHYRISNAEISMVKLRKETLKYVPGVFRWTFKKLYYYHPQVSERCKKCGICVKSCPVQAIAWPEGKRPEVMKDDCIKCMCCHELCPHQAIDIHKSLLAKAVLR
jgi:uncharacterized protein (DUF362 family)/NAD-dependent dihydropyrimidine dehydrogenase PreA subunit